MNRIRTALTALTTALLVTVIPGMAFAAGDGIAAGDQGWVGLGAGLAIGFAALGCGIGQASAPTARSTASPATPARRARSRPR